MQEDWDKEDLLIAYLGFSIVLSMLTIALIFGTLS
jgi:hypothetical protein